jgi:hypothetical protein
MPGPPGAVPMMAPQMGAIWGDQSLVAFAAQFGITPELIAHVAEFSFAQYNSFDDNTKQAITAVRTMMGLPPVPTS